MEFIEGEAPAFTIQQMILDLMDLCYYDGEAGAQYGYGEDTCKMREEIFQYIEALAPMPTFNDPQGQKLWVWDSIVTLSLDIPTPGGIDLDKTQVTELVSFLQSWLEKSGESNE